MPRSSRAGAPGLLVQWPAAVAGTFLGWNCPHVLLWAVASASPSLLATKQEARSITAEVLHYLGHEGNPRKPGGFAMAVKGKDWGFCCLHCFWWTETVKQEPSLTESNSCLVTNQHWNRKWIESVLVGSCILSLMLFENFTARKKRKNKKKVYPLIKLAQNPMCLYLQQAKNIKKIQYLCSMLWKFNSKIQYNFPIKITCSWLSSINITSSHCILKLSTQYCYVNIPRLKISNYCLDNSLLAIAEWM